MKEGEAKYINKLEAENAELKRQLEAFRLPEVGEFFKFPGNPYTYKLCRIELENCKFFVLFNVIKNNFYSEPKETIKEAFGFHTNNYYNRTRVNDPRSQQEVPHPYSK